MADADLQDKLSGSWLMGWRLGAGVLLGEMAQALGMTSSELSALDHGRARWTPEIHAKVRAFMQAHHDARRKGGSHA